MNTLIMRGWMMLHELEKNVVFYPCCAADYEFPVQLLGSPDNLYIFCDLRRYPDWRQFKKLHPNSRLLTMDAWEAIEQLPKVNTLFYRRDGMSEGGSGVRVLSNEYLSLLLEKFPSTGGNIITDGSNAFGERLEEMLSGKLMVKNFKILPIRYDANKNDLYEFKVVPEGVLPL